MHLVSSEVGKREAEMKMEGVRLVFIIVLVPLSFCLTEVTELSFLSSPRAVCLDGSRAAFYFRRGDLNNEKKWIIFLQGGGFCSSVEDCLETSKTDLGSSKKMAKFMQLGKRRPILSNDRAVNPDFAGWNVVFVPYCDGGFFAGNWTQDQLHFQGQSIMLSLVNDMLIQGMSDASDVILTGCSAGAVASLIWGDRIGSLLPETTFYRIIVGSGFFPFSSNVKNQPIIIDEMKNTFALHHGTAPKACLLLNRSHPFECWFGYRIIPSMRTSLFLVNSIYDRVALALIFAANVTSWHDCIWSREGPSGCNHAEVLALNSVWRPKLMEQISVLKTNPENGYFLHSCFTHCQVSNGKNEWNRLRIGDRTVREVIGKWYRGARERLVDCQWVSNYYCNPTC